jgi:ATP-binding cassette subfamily B protein
VGQVRARIAGQTQESLSELTSITQETLSVSGILLSKAFNRQRTESARYQENTNQVRLQVQAMSGQGFFAVVQVLMASVPAVIYLVSGYLIAGGTDDHRRHRRRVHDRAGALLMPLMGSCGSRSICRRRGRCSPASSSTSTGPRDPGCPDAITVAAAPDRRTHRVPDVVFRYPDAAPEARPTLDVSFVAEPGSTSPSSGPPARARRPCCTSRRDSTRPPRARALLRRRRATLTQESIIDHIGIVSQETYLFHATIRENLRYAKPDATDADRGRVHGANIHHIITGSSTATTPSSASAATASRAVRSSASRSRVLLKDPPVLLLDEATSRSTPCRSGRAGGARRGGVGRTTLSIAHRLSTVVGADVIHVVEAGRIVESGTHASCWRTAGSTPSSPPSRWPRLGSRASIRRQLPGLPSACRPRPEARRGGCRAPVADPPVERAGMKRGAP